MSRRGHRRVEPWTEEQREEFKLRVKAALMMTPPDKPVREDQLRLHARKADNMKGEHRGN